MSDKAILVQFTHPGGQHTLNAKEQKSGIKEWNYGPHRRKFLKAEGRYAQKNGTLSPRMQLLFWGEWEPTSQATAIEHSEGSGIMPKMVHEPFLYKENGTLITPPGKDSRGRTRQNTDPFVFGECFLYSCCKQRKRIKKSNRTKFTRMGRLTAGSIILFGSTISRKEGGPYFVLDTLFVVDEQKEYTKEKSLNEFIPHDYNEIMSFEHWADDYNFVCYKGATARRPINGMFSFVPCKPCADRVAGFPRVRLGSGDFNFITDNLNAAPKYSSHDNIKKVWERLCDIVRQQGFELGVDFCYNYRH